MSEEEKAFLPDAVFKFKRSASPAQIKRVIEEWKERYTGKLVIIENEDVEYFQMNVEYGIWSNNNKCWYTDNNGIPYHGSKALMTALLQNEPESYIRAMLFEVRPLGDMPKSTSSETTRERT